MQVRYNRYILPKGRTKITTECPAIHYKETCYKLQNMRNKKYMFFRLKSPLQPSRNGHRTIQKLLKSNGKEEKFRRPERKNEVPTNLSDRL